MAVTAVVTMINSNEQRTTNYSKQTQTNPILNGADSVELAEQPGQQTNLADRSKVYLWGVSAFIVSGCVNRGLREVAGTIFAPIKKQGMVLEQSKLDEVNVLASGADWAWPEAQRDIFRPRGANLLVAEIAVESKR